MTETRLRVWDALLTIIISWCVIGVCFIVTLCYEIHIHGKQMYVTNALFYFSLVKTYLFMNIWHAIHNIHSLAKVWNWNESNMLIVFLTGNITWAPPSEFVSSSIPSWQILTAHAQPFRGARDLAFYLKVPLDSLLVWASSEGSGETARMRRLAWTFAARIGYKYQIRLTRSTL